MIMKWPNKDLLNIDLEVLQRNVWTNTIKIHLWFKLNLFKTKLKSELFNETAILN
jgi:hypothetical protein